MLSNVFQCFSGYVLFCLLFLLRFSDVHIMIIGIFSIGGVMLYLVGSVRMYSFLQIDGAIHGMLNSNVVCVESLLVL